MVVSRDRPTEQTMHVYCPMVDRTVSIDTCADCPMCAGLEGKRSGQRPLVLCSYDAPLVPPRLRPVGSALLRYSVGVRGEWVEGALSTVPYAETLVPILDHASLVVAISYSGHLVAEGAPGRSFEEHEFVGEVLSRMADLHIRQGPVVARDGTFVGIADDLHLIRSLRGEGYDPLA
jgi:hypothetical protein